MRQVQPLFRPEVSEVKAAIEELVRRKYVRYAHSGEEAGRLVYVA